MAVAMKIELSKPLHGCIWGILLKFFYQEEKYGGFKAYSSD